MKRIVQKLQVPHEYSVFFTRGVFCSRNPVLASLLVPETEGAAVRTLVYVDSGVAKAVSGLLHAICGYARANRRCMELLADPRLVPGGERCKDGWKVAQRIVEDIGRHHLCRHCCVIAVGGGSVLDVVGFAAALVHRGVRLIRIPTTVLAQNDAGVGVKNGINHLGSKNFVGTFAPPFAVIDDFDFLSTLPEREWRGGVAEAFKVAIIKDQKFFRFLQAHAADLKARNESAMERAVRWCAALHLDHIRAGGDPFEMGSARPLDFGHWCAHRLEVMSGYRLGHGQAVAIGMALDSFYAREKGMITSTHLQSILDALRVAGLAIWDPLLGRKTRAGRLEILDGLEQFREHLGGRLSITLPCGIGKKKEVHDMDLTLLRRGVSFLEKFSVTGTMNL